MDKWTLIICFLLGALMLVSGGCSGSGFVAIGGSGATYNPNNEYAPKIVQLQPTQSVTIGRAKILPMVGSK